MDNLINLSKTNKPLNVYRGISFSSANKTLVNKFVNLKVGDKFFEKGYLSTSYSFNVSNGYAFKDDDISIIFDIDVAKGVNCIPLLYKDDISNKDEFEILIHQQSKLEIIKKMSNKIEERFIIYYKTRIIE